MEEIFDEHINVVSDLEGNHFDLVLKESAKIGNH